MTATPARRNRGIPVETGALLTALVGALVGALVSVIVGRGSSLPLGGEASVGGLTAATATLLGIPTFAVAYTRFSRREVRWRLRPKWRRAIDTIGLTLTGCAMAGLLIVSVFTVFQLAFQDLSLDPFAAAVIAGAAVAASNYALFLLASQITTNRLASLLGLFLIAGIFASMLSADDPTWWQHNFSSLGMGSTASAQAFNLTVIIAGLVVTTLADYLTVDLRSRRSSRGSDLRGVTVVRVALVVVGVALMGVGFAPVDLSVVVHNVFAISALVGFAALIVLAPIVLRDLPRTFVVTTLVFIAGLVVIVLLFVPFGYYNLTAVELLAVLVIFAWLVLFTRAASAGRDVRVPPAVRPVAAVANPSRPSAVGLVALVVLAATISGIAGFLTGARRRG